MESLEQEGFLIWFEAKFPRVRIFAIPNGGKRNIKTARRLKAEGVKRGVPDLYVPAWNLWIEMKRKSGGRLSPDQIDWIDYLRTIGHTAIVGHGAEDASGQVMDFVKEYSSNQ